MGQHFSKVRGTVILGPSKGASKVRGPGPPASLVPTPMSAAASASRGMYETAASAATGLSGLV